MECSRRGVLMMPSRNHAAPSIPSPHGRGMARRVIAAAASLGLMAMMAVATAAPAAAHVPQASLFCDNNGPKLTINLTQYNSNVTNTVAAWIDGSSVLGATTFSTSYSNSFSAGSPFTDHTAKVEVKAGDDPTGSHGWTKTFDVKLGACQEPTPSPTPKPAPTVVSNTCESIKISKLPDNWKLIVEPGDHLYTENGTFDIAAGSYTYEFRNSDNEDASGGEFTVDLCPTPTPPPTPVVVSSDCAGITVSGMPEGWKLIVEPGDQLFTANGTFSEAPGSYTYEFRNSDNEDITGGKLTVAA